MTRSELVTLTLDQLLVTFKANPECFDLELTDTKSFSNVINDAIVWKHRIEQESSFIADPHNPARTVIVVHNKATEEIQCFIYMTDIKNVNSMNSLKADAEMVAQIGTIRLFDANYRRFMQLKKLIQKRNKDKEKDKFLSKLYSIFPGTFDDHIFGKK